jgi:putative membrane protein
VIHGGITVKLSSAAVAAAAVLLCAGVAGCSSSTSSTAASDTAAPSSAGGANQGADWLTAVHEDDMAEVQAGKLAQQSGSTASVRDTGSMLETDHGLIDAGIMMLAEKHHVTLPSALNPKLAAEIQKLQGLQGPAFDQSFVPFFIAGHQSAVKATQGETTDGTQPSDVVAYAKVVLPVLQRHLDHLQMDANMH